MSFLRDRLEKNWPELLATLRGGMPRFVLSERAVPLGQAVPVFCYHVVERDVFAADLDFLRRNGYTSIGADALLDHLRGQRAAPERSVVLTFDDGARNLHQVVYPLLRAHQQRAVAFVAPHFHLQPTDAQDVPDRPCTWKELLEMHGSGLVDIQSHSYEHRYAPRWPEPVALAGVAPRFGRVSQAPPSIDDDYRRAREVLEQALVKRVRHLAFPRFDGTPAAERAAVECGYEGLWRGLEVGRPLNHPGDNGLGIVRMSGEFVRRLPGEGRVSLGSVLRRRYGRALRGGGRWAR